MFSPINADYPSFANPPAITRTAAQLDELKAAVVASYKQFSVAKTGQETAHRAFADACFALYQNRAQGNKTGRGFSAALEASMVCKVKS